MKEKEVVFECNGCGRCCKYWKIALNIKDIKTLQRLGFKIKDFVGLDVENPILKMKKGKCIFLDKNDKCIIQKKFGHDSKPDVCKSFPHNEAVCGNPKFSEKKNTAKHYKRDIFFRISKKENLKNIDTSKPLFGSYCKFLFTINNQE